MDPNYVLLKRDETADSIMVRALQNTVLVNRFTKKPYVILSHGSMPFAMPFKKEGGPALASLSGRIYTFELCRDGNSYAETSLIDMLKDKPYDSSNEMRDKSEILIDPERVELLRLQHPNLYESLFGRRPSVSLAS